MYHYHQQELVSQRRLDLGSQGEALPDHQLNTQLQSVVKVVWSCIYIYVLQCSGVLLFGGGSIIGGSVVSGAAVAGDYWLKVRRVVLSLSHHPRTRLQITLLPHCTLCTIHSVHFAHFTVHWAKKVLRCCTYKVFSAWWDTLLTGLLGGGTRGRWDSSPQIQKMHLRWMSQVEWIGWNHWMGWGKNTNKNSFGWKNGEC